MYENLVHSFRIDFAKEYGIEEAILLQYFGFWMDKNEANGRNFKDGAYWTYMSFAGLVKLFPYMSSRTIKRKIKHLKKLGLIKVQNFNTDNSGSSNWYTIDCVKLSQASDKVAQGLCQVGTRSVPNCHTPIITVYTSSNTLESLNTKTPDVLKTKTPNKVLKAKGAVETQKAFKESSREAHVSSHQPEVIAHFVSAYQAKTGNKYLFTGRDAKEISNMLQVTDKDDLKKRIDVFFASNDPFYSKAGYTTGVLSAVINKLSIAKPVASGASGRSL